MWATADVPFGSLYITPSAGQIAPRSSESQGEAVVPQNSMQMPPKGLNESQTPEMQSVLAEHGPPPPILPTAGLNPVLLQMVAQPFPALLGIRVQPAVPVPSPHWLCEVHWATHEATDVVSVACALSVHVMGSDAHAPVPVAVQSVSTEHPP